MTAEPKVYSYIRFSTPDQAMGDSERRQWDAAQRCAEKQGMLLDDALRIVDRGVSGFHGDNRKRGALGQFLQRVENGDVAPGSILLVENIDRLTREGAVTAIRKIIGCLWDHGIILQTLSPDISYPPESEKEDKCILMFLYLQLAQEGSKRKSDLQKANWEQKRKLARKGILMTGRAPAWLDKKGNGFETIEEAAEAVRRIFDLRLQGMGTRKIAIKLNSEGAWTAPKSPKRRSEGWRHSYINKILRSRAVIGEFQPHTKQGGKRRPIEEPIPNYYPRIVDPGVFHSVQMMLKENKGKGGRTGKGGNLFTHLVKCAYCGAAMHLIDKGSPPKGSKYLVCDYGRRAVRYENEPRDLRCKRRSIRYDEVEKTVIDNCLGLRPEEVLPNPAEEEKHCQRLRKELRGIEAQQADIEEQLKHVRVHLGRSSPPEFSQMCIERQSELLADKAKFERRQRAKEQELLKVESGLKSFEKWHEGLKDLREALADSNNPELRKRLNIHLKQLIDKIEVFSVGLAEPWVGDPATSEQENAPAGRREARRPASAKSENPVTHDVAGDETAGSQKSTHEVVLPEEKHELADYICEIVAEVAPHELRSEWFNDFFHWVTERRMAKGGRFLRIHFKTGTRRDVVPKGSLAFGRQLEVNEDGKVGWRIIQPDIDRLRQEFLRKRKKRR